MQNISVLKKSPLFRDIDDIELSSMLGCISTKTLKYKKGEFVFRTGEKITLIGMVLSGSVHIIKEDFWGNRNIIGEASQSDVFGEAYACSTNEVLEISVVAAENSEIIFFDINKVIKVCGSACSFHSRLIQNLISVISKKNIILTKKMEHMSKKSTREKLLSYLSSESIKNNSPEFLIPFNRQQLADYRGVDRSAMSSELGRLRNEGLLTFNKNHFILSQDFDENFY